MRLQHDEEFNISLELSLKKDSLKVGHNVKNLLTQKGIDLSDVEFYLSVKYFSSNFRANSLSLVLFQTERNVQCLGILEEIAIDVILKKLYFCVKICSIKKVSHLGVFQVSEIQDSAVTTTDKLILAKPIQMYNLKDYKGIVQKVFSLHTRGVNNRESPFEIC
jgi:hypothetical protein